MSSDARGEVALVVVVALAYLLSVIHVSHLAWVWWGSSGPKRGCISRWAADARAWALGRRSQQDSAADAKIRGLIERERTRCIRTIAGPFVHFTALYLIYRMSRDIQVAATSTESSAALSRFSLEYLNRMEDIVLLFLLCKLALTFPARLTSRATSAVFVVTCVFEVAKSLFLLPLKYVIVDQAVSQGLLIVLGIIVCNSRLTAVCHIVVRSTIGVYLYRQALRASEGEVLFGMEDRVLVQNVFLGIGQGLIMVCLESAVWTASREVLAGKATLTTERRARRIISALCDAVVTLGPDLRISERAPKLANLLLRSSAARALEGASFTDLLLESDKARFHSFLKRTVDTEDEDEGADGSSPAQALLASLRDGNGTGVTVQLYHTCFRDEDNEIGHLLGICEVGDGPGSQAVQPPCDLRREEPGRRRSGGSDMDSGSDSSDTLDLSASTRRARRAAAAELIRAAGRSAGGAGHGPLPSANELGGEEPPEPWQLLRPEECGIAFEKLRFQVGGSQRTALPAIDASLTTNDSLQSWVAEWPSCRAWLQDLTNAALRPIRPTSWRDPSNPPAFVRLNVAFQATCAVPQDFLQMSPSDGGGASAQHPPMRLPLASVRLLKCATTRTAHRVAERLRGQQRRNQQAVVQPAMIGCASASTEGGARGVAVDVPESRAVGPYVCL